MKYVDEFRDGKLAANIVASIVREAEPQRHSGQGQGRQDHGLQRVERAGGEEGHKVRPRDKPR